MRKFYLFHPLALAFHSKELYRDVAYRWKGTGLLYLLFAVTLCWIVLCLRLHFVVGGAIDQLMPVIFKTVPPITISKGTAAIDAVEPYIILDPDTGKVVAVLDTTGKFNKLEDTDGAYLLLTKTHLHMLDQNTGRVNSTPLAQLPDISLDRKNMQEFAEKVKASAALIVFPFAVAISYVYRLIQLLLYAALANIICDSLKTRLNFTTLMRLSAVAVTPALLLNTLLWTLGLDLGYLWWVICFGITMYYLYFGIRAAADTPPDQQAPAEVKPTDAAQSPWGNQAAQSQSPWGNLAPPSKPKPDDAPAPGAPPASPPAPALPPPSPPGPDQASQK